MKCVIDIEANSLVRPTQIWLIVCQDIDTDKIYIFRNVTTNDEEAKRFLSFAKDVELYIGHNLLEYDLPVCGSLLGDSFHYSADRCIDTLIVSRLMHYSRDAGHSLESYGKEFGLPKIKFNDWTKWSQEMEDYCVQDVLINRRIYEHFQRHIFDARWNDAIRTEHRFQLLVNDLHTNGFGFNRSRAESLLRGVSQELEKLDTEILKAFPPRLELIREIHPKVTKHGTLSKTDFRWVSDGDLSEFNGGPFSRCEWVPFNPSSHKQLIDVLSLAGWKPTDKTTTHIQLERDLSRQKWAREKINPLDIQEQYVKLNKLKKYGWKINEENLATLPKNAPSPARSLAKRILLESRRRTLTEWLGLVQDDNRIHGKFLGIGTWTHRMATQKPNMQNIPNEYDEQQRVKYLGKELRQLWQAPRNRLLVGVDAEGIQLRLLAHYIDEAEFTHALVHGKKSDKTDPHSLNQRILGSVCKSRQAAKRFIYALILGAGLGKLAEILECSDDEAQEALDRIMERYQGWSNLKRTVFPNDAKKGYIIGLDGRKVALPGDTPGERRHLAMSAYLQNGESICIKCAAIKFDPELKKIDERARLVNIVHDEYVIECSNSLDKAKKIKRLVCDAIEETGRDLKLLCPLAGSGDVGLTWYDIH